MSDRRTNNPLVAPLLGSRSNDGTSKAAEVSSLLGTSDIAYRILPASAPLENNMNNQRGIELETNNRSNNLALLPPPPPPNGNNNNNRLPNMGLGIAEVSSTSYTVLCNPTGPPKTENRDR